MSEPVPSPGSADFIGDYQVLEGLGRGGMGEVLLAWDERLQRRVAIKRIRHEGEITPTLRQRLLREAQTVAGLSHPAIVHVYELLKDDAGDDCIVMEYVEGRTVAAALMDGPLEPFIAVRLALEIASGLAAAHEAGIVHRDLKAENVIVTPSGHAKILDFGLAKPLVPAEGDPTLTMSGLVLGTCRSMSPEQAKGAEVDGRSDLFSLGVLLYEMLTGQPPFRGSGALEVLTQVISKVPPRVDTIRPAIPPRLGNLIERLLEKDPASRPHSAAEVVRELEALAVTIGSSPVSPSGETISELPTGYHTPSSPPLSQPLPQSGVASESTPRVHIPAQQRRVRIAALVALGIVILGVALALILRWRHASPPPAPVRSLRVLVREPVVIGKSQRLQSATTPVMKEILTTLNTLVGVEWLYPSGVTGAKASEKERPKAEAADEILVAILAEDGATCTITLSRTSTLNQVQSPKDDTFEAALPVEDRDLLKKVVAGGVNKLYSEYKSRPVPPTLEVNDQDYKIFLAIKRDIPTAETQDVLTRLTAVIESSPDFLEAQLLAADMNLTQFESTHQSLYLDKAEDLVQRARALAPGDARPLFIRFKVEMARDQTRDAEATFEQLQKLRAGDPQLLLLSSKLAERHERRNEALDDLRQLVKELPTWENLYFLADLEARTDHIADARSHLDRILSDSPANIWALEKRAEIELLYGNPVEAEDRYRKLIDKTRIHPHRPYYTNRGNALVLLERYKEAVEAFQKARSFDDNNVVVTINLADAELALGHGEKARKYYRKALDHLDNLPEDSLSPDDQAARAQCLVHLDQFQDAKTAIEKALDARPDDDNVLQAAALVYAVMGERDLAVDTIKKALNKGVQPRWFQLPAFDTLKDDPDYQRLMKKTPGATPSSR